MPKAARDAADERLDPRLPARAGDAEVAEVMISVPTTHRVDITVGEAREALARPKLHMVLLVQSVDGEPRLMGALVEGDIPDAADDVEPARTYASLLGRTVAADVRLAEVWEDLKRADGRRLAVVDAENKLLGLVCLKRSRAGFCTDDGVTAWRRERDSALD